MPCYHPIPGWYAKHRNETGKRSIVFRLDDGFKDRPVEVPCGSCIGCQLERARQWAVRCSHEASLHEANRFVTLTYRPECVPPGGSLRPEDFVLFMKRLRFRLGPGIRFFQCGEYGERLGRPHHHALLFNCSFPDEVLMRGGERPLWTSALLDELWGHGFCSIGTVTFESAGYVARYAMKKVKGHDAVAHYQGRVPEYLTMSRRPGIGRGWIDKFASDVFPSGELVVRGAVSRPPRYYEDVSEKVMPAAVRVAKRKRAEAGRDDPHNSGRRLVAREEVKQASVTFLSRDLEAQ